MLRTVNVFPKLVVFLSQNSQNLQDVSNKKKNLTPEVFFSSNTAQKPASGSQSPKEYTENGLT